MTLNPYQSPTIAGQPPAEVPLSFRRRYWFEMVIVSDALLLIIVAVVHRCLRGVPEWYHYRPVVLFIVGCWVSAPALAICACVRSLFLLNKTSAWRSIGTASFAILIMLTHMLATWINPWMDTASARTIVDLLLYFWPKGVTFP